MKPVGPHVQVANMNEQVTKGVETTSATVAVSEISEVTDNTDVKNHSLENSTSASSTEFTDTSADKTPEGVNLIDEQKSLNRVTEASETDLATASDTSESLNAKQSGKKKKGRKTNWTSVPLEFPPHRPTGRGKGRKRGRGQGSTTAAEEFERSQETQTISENLAPIGTRGRGGSRGGRRGGRGRGPQYYREQNFLIDPNPQFCYCPPMWVVYKQLKEQVEFYFYNPKLAEDFFLRRNMDSHGYVELSKIATFDQVSKITQGLHNVVGLLVQALRPSELLELSSDKMCVRRKFSPEKWILGNNPSVFSSLRPDAPEFVYEPPGSKKDEKQEDQNIEAKETGDVTEMTTSIAQNLDPIKNIAEKSTENSTENSTDLIQKAEFSDAASNGEECRAIVGTADVVISDDTKFTESNVEVRDLENEGNNNNI